LEANIEAHKEEAEMRENILIDHLKEITNNLNQLEANWSRRERTRRRNNYIKNSS
jgi:hypothetical protein